MHAGHGLPKAGTRETVDENEPIKRKWYELVVVVALSWVKAEPLYPHHNYILG